MNTPGALAEALNCTLVSGAGCMMPAGVGQFRKVPCVRNQSGQVFVADRGEGIMGATEAGPAPTALAPSRGGP